MNKVGQLIELDPNKKYVMLVERNILSEQDLQMLALHMQKQEGSLMAITLPNFDCIQFVENSERIVDIVETKEDGTQQPAPLEAAPKQDDTQQ